MGRNLPGVISDSGIVWGPDSGFRLTDWTLEAGAELLGGLPYGIPAG